MTDAQAALAFFPWETEYRPSWLVLKQTGPRAATVIRVAPQAVLGHGKCRMFEAWRGGQKIYDPTTEYKIGQRVEA